ncbi:MAG TPA: PEP-CTERM sorting domain-containing protein [Phycisphaerae bacterium]|nr:PEP-CTERM sorting domain-containing protein [Phycisphaerae bacterium]
MKRSILSMVMAAGVMCIPGLAMAAAPNVPAGYTIELYASGLPHVQSLAFSPGGEFGYEGQLFASYGGDVGHVVRIPSQGVVTYFSPCRDNGAHDLIFAAPNSAFGPYLYAVQYSSIERYDKNGMRTQFASVEQQPVDLEFGPGGDWGTYLYQGDSWGYDGDIDSVRRWDSDGNKTYVLYRGRENIKAMTFGTAGVWGTDLYLGYGPWPGASPWPYVEQGGVVKCDPNGNLTDFVLADSNVIGRMGDVAIDPTGKYFGGDMFFSELQYGRIYHVDANGNMSLFMTGMDSYTCIYGGDICFGPDGAMYLAERVEGNIWRVTPEPGTVALLGLGAAVLVRRRRRRK